MPHQTWGSFEIGPIDGGAELRLCYKFQTEPFKEYANITVIIKNIDNVVASLGEGNVAIYNVPKRLSFEGSGIQYGDHVKWISSLATDDSHCEALPSEGGDDSRDEDGLYMVDADSSVDVIFTEDSGGMDWKLCYRFKVLFRTRPFS